MREIKFRVWDEDSKKYLDGDWSISALNGQVRGKYGETFENLVTEQYTGLKDKNGKEIFEGDILQWVDTTSNYPNKVTNRVTIEIIHAFRTKPSMLFAGTEYEVIGNIHDTPYGE